VNRLRRGSGSASVSRRTASGTVHTRSAIGIHGKRGRWARDAESSSPINHCGSSWQFSSHAVTVARYQRSGSPRRSQRRRWCAGCSCPSSVAQVPR
jgi:hypothetical protein